MSKLYFLALAASLLCSGTPFTNGSFETNSGGNCTAAIGSFATLGVGETCITGWTASNIDYINGYWTAQDPTHSLDLNGLTSGSIQQTFDVNQGHTYQVTFYLAGNSELAPAVKTLNVIVAGSTIPFSFDVTGDSRFSMGWVQETFTFNTLLETTDTLQFVSTTPGAGGPALDLVTLTDLGRTVATTPEPSTLGFLGIGGAVLAMIRRKRA